MRGYQRGIWLQEIKAIRAVRRGWREVPGGWVCTCRLGRFGSLTPLGDGETATTVIARSKATKQSILSWCGDMDCVASLAMTRIHLRDLATHCARGLLETLRPRWSEGAGKTGCALHPRSRVQCAQRVRTRAYRSSGEHPAFPAQWLYGL